MRSRLLLFVISLSLLSLTALTPSQAAESQGAEEFLSIEAPSSVAPGWRGDVTITGSADTYDRLSLELTAPNGDQLLLPQRVPVGGSSSKFTRDFEIPPLNRGGVYTLSAVLERAQITETAELRVRPEFELAAVSRQYFYPTVRDRFQDSVTIRWRPNGRLPVEMYVLNDRDQKVMQWPTQTWRPYYGRREWYGKDSRGRSLPVGRYRIRMIARALNGQIATKTLPVRIVSDIVTKRSAPAKRGTQTAKRTRRGDCYYYPNSYDGTLLISCSDYDGGSQARATWGFKLPPSARDVKWGISGRVGCCAQGELRKTGTRTSKTRYTVAINLSRLRMFTVNRAWVSYKYDKRR